VDTTPPDVTIASPVEGSYFNTPPVWLNGTCYDTLSGTKSVEIKIIREDNYTITNKWALICVSANDFEDSPDQDGFPASGLQAYYILKARGYDDEHIIFMLWHNSNNGGNDTWVSIYDPGYNDLWGPDHLQGTADDPVIDFDHNTPINKTLLRQQIQLLAGKVKPGDEVVVYLVNHGSKFEGNVYFCFEGSSYVSDMVSKDELHSWLEWVRVNCSRITLLVDTCHSGDFIVPFNESNYVCVSATGDCKSGWYWMEATSNRYAGSWFFHPFWEKIDGGWSIKDAYDFGCSYVPYDKTQNMSAIQDPWLIDNVGDAKDYTFIGYHIYWINTNLAANCSWWDYYFTPPEGNYTIYIRAVDNAGNYQQAITVNITYDISPPDTTIDDIPDYVNSLSSITGTSSDTVSGVNKIQIRIYNVTGGTNWTGFGWSNAEVWLDAVGYTTWSYNSSGVTWQDGLSYTIYAKVTDNATNIGTMNESFGFDTTPPELEILTPSEGANVISNAWFNGTCSDSLSGIKTVEINITNNDTGEIIVEWTVVNFTSAEWNYSCTLTVGVNYTVVVKVVDNASNTQTKTINISCTSAKKYFSDSASQHKTISLFIAETKVEIYLREAL